MCLTCTVWFHVISSSEEYTETFGQKKVGLALFIKYSLGTFLYKWLTRNYENYNVEIAGIECFAERLNHVLEGSIEVG